MRKGHFRKQHLGQLDTGWLSLTEPDKVVRKRETSVSTGILWRIQQASRGRRGVEGDTGAFWKQSCSVVPGGLRGRSSLSEGTLGPSLGRVASAECGTCVLRGAPDPEPQTRTDRW